MLLLQQHLQEQWSQHFNNNHKTKKNKVDFGKWKDVQEITIKERRLLQTSITVICKYYGSMRDNDYVQHQIIWPHVDIRVYSSVEDCYLHTSDYLKVHT